MTIKLPNHHIYYDSVPKTACTSVKSWLYHLAFKKEFEKYKRQGKIFHIHNYIRDNSLDRSKKFEIINSKKRTDMLSTIKKNFFYFCIIREPIKRFISAYSNRVIHHGFLREEILPFMAFRSRGLKPDPELNYFVENLEDYQEIQPDIMSHTKPMINFLDINIGYTHVYEISMLDSFIKDIGDFLSRESNSTFLTEALTKLPRYQTGGKKLGLEHLSPRSFNKMCEYYASDYEYIARLRQKHSGISALNRDAIEKEYLECIKR